MVPVITNPVALAAAGSAGVDSAEEASAVVATAEVVVATAEAAVTTRPGGS